MRKPLTAGYSLSVAALERGADPRRPEEERVEPEQRERVVGDLDVRPEQLEAEDDHEGARVYEKRLAPPDAVPEEERVRDVRDRVGLAPVAVRSDRDVVRHPHHHDAGERRDEEVHPPVPKNEKHAEPEQEDVKEKPAWRWGSRSTPVRKPVTTDTGYT